MISMKTIRVIFIGILFCLLFISEPSFGQIYKWIDEKGTINFSDDPWKREFSGMVEKDGWKIIRFGASSPRVQNKIPTGRSYYDAHPEERLIDETIQANKPLMDMYEKLVEDIRIVGQGYGGGRHSDYSSPSSPPPPPPVPSTPGVLIQGPFGAIHSGTGDFYPKSGRGLIDPKTGGFLPDVGGGYIDPKTGRFIPKK